MSLGYVVYNIVSGEKFYVDSRPDGLSWVITRSLDDKHHTRVKTSWYMIEIMSQESEEKERSYDIYF